MTFNIKRHYSSLKESVVPLDYFIFTCFEEEQNLKSMGGVLPQGFKRHPKVLIFNREDSFAEQAAFLEKSFFDIADEVFSWYTETYPVFVSQDVLNYAQHSKLLYPLAALLFDIQTVYHKKEGQGKFPRFTSGADASDQQEAYGANFWISFEELIQKHMPAYGQMLISYLHWFYGHSRQKQYDLSSLPPTGRYLSLIKKGTSSRSSSKAPHTQEPRSQNTQASASNKTASSSTGDKEQEVDQAVIQEAIEAAMKAIATLQADASQDTIILAPQNSYVRRKQHKEIVAAGFESLSVGEGKDRSVQIKRL